MLDAFRVSRRITASLSFYLDDITAMIAATDENRGECSVFPSMCGGGISLMRGKNVSENNFCPIVYHPYYSS